MFYKNTVEIVSMQKLSAKIELALVPATSLSGGGALSASLGPAGSSRAELDARIFSSETRDIVQKVIKICSLLNILII